MACGVLVLLVRFAVGLCWSAFLLVLLVLCCAMCALLSVVIWCTRAVMRCNRFSVSGGVVFYLARYRAIVACFISVYYVFG